MWNKLGQKALNYGAKKLGTGVVRNTFDTIDKVMNEAYGIKPLNSDENSKITAMRYCHKILCVSRFLYGIVTMPSK